MRRVMGVLVLAALTVLACGIPAATYKVEKSVDYEASFDKVWAAVIETLAENLIPIDNMEKDSGYVSTRECKFPESYADSGKTPLGIKFTGPVYGTFNVFVKERPNGGASVQINCSYHLKTDNMYYKGSESTGEFETKFHETIRAKLL